MNQQAQSKMLFGIGAITAAVIAGYFGLDYFGGKKTQAAAPATEAATDAGSSGDYAAAVNAATESALANAGDSTSLTAEDARRIGEEVARQVATEVARSIIDQKAAGGTEAASGDGASGLTEADARRIGEEEGRRVAEEVASATIQQALAANAGSGSGGGLSAEEAEQIGLAAGRRAAKQVAASTAREIVRKEFGDNTAVASASTGGDAAAAAPSSAGSSTGASKSSPQKASPGTDVLRAWWTTPASGDFGLLYAGQPQNESAIALLFNEQPADSALNQSVKVYDYKGNLVSGSWEPAANPRMAVLRGLKPGRYTVVVEPALSNAGGKAVSKGQHGPVYVS